MVRSDSCLQSELVASFFFLYVLLCVSFQVCLFECALQVGIYSFILNTLWAKFSWCVCVRVSLRFGRFHDLQVGLVSYYCVWLDLVGFGWLCVGLNYFELSAERCGYFTAAYPINASA